jgi:hypothetical protein
MPTKPQAYPGSSRNTMGDCCVTTRSETLKHPFRMGVLRRGRSFLLPILVPAIALLGVAPAHPRQSSHPPASATPSCHRLIITAEVRAGQEWSAPIGQGWLLRLVPIAPSGQDYSGWDLAVSPPGDTAYPDALLLATPPYGSLSEREIGTTFGLRAQDAIAWQPRHFHFLLSARDLATARRLFQQLTAASSAQSASTRASAELMQLVTHQQGPLAGQKPGSGQLQPNSAMFPTQLSKQATPPLPGASCSPCVSQRYCGCPTHGNCPQTSRLEPARIGQLVPNDTDRGFSTQKMGQLCSIENKCIVYCCYVREHSDRTLGR